MAIHGSALGGGLELALAGHYRVAVASARIGQPEVNLGLIPGGEGTQRLPRLAGIGAALDLCVTGQPIGAAAALTAGIIDAIVGDDLTRSAGAFARDAARRGRVVKTRERRDRLEDPASAAPLLASARRRAESARPFEQAPIRAIEAIGAAASVPFDEGCRRERALFLACLRGEQARAMIHLFFAERASAKAMRDAGAGAPSASLGSRLARAYLAEKQSLAADGASPDAIERALTAFGMKAGTLESAPATDDAPEPPRRQQSLHWRAISDADLVDRVIYALVNHGARALEAREAARASDVDLAGVTTCGFPVWRGGPMFHADRIGLAAVLARIEAFHREHGTRWTPAPLLVELARSGQTFRERDRSLKA
jgi:enoyl-CoA hydratase/carnithine racemase